MASDGELKRIVKELKHLSFRRQQLLERKKIQCVFQELRNRAEFGQADEAAFNQPEIDNIDEQLKQLTDRKSELQKSYESIVDAKDKNKKEDKPSSIKKVVLGPAAPASNIFYVEAPPTYPAPAVILDFEKLPPTPTRTQCPECRQFILTETSTSVSSVTWLVCFMTALLGCAAGCCLIPFCLDRFKTIVHRCPKCRTKIHAVKKL